MHWLRIAAQALPLLLSPVSGQSISSTAFSSPVGTSSGSLQTATTTSKDIFACGSNTACKNATSIFDVCTRLNVGYSAQLDCQCTRGYVPAYLACYACSSSNNLLFTAFTTTMAEAAIGNCSTRLQPTSVTSYTLPPTGPPNATPASSAGTQTATPTSNVSARMRLPLAEFGVLPLLGSLLLGSLL